MLAGWAASAARFREDANAEEDLVLGGYRDRVLIELAQNAADAAARARQSGRMRIRLAGGVLSVANTGTTLDAEGVQALATLRASAKRATGTVGRFGVGFAAVLAVSDEPEVRSTAGGVAFSAARTHALVAGIPSLAEELARRGGAVPVLRLPFGIDDPPVAGFVTEVRLPLRPDTEKVVRRQLAALTADLLLALPALAEIDVDGRLLRRTESYSDEVELHDGDAVRRWRLSTAEGNIPDAVLAGRPVEERERTTWSIRWAVPVADGRVEPLPGRQVVHAPTPSDEPLSVPVRMVASYPLDPDRRHVAPGPLTDFLTAQAASAYVGLLRSFGDDPRVLGLVPRMGLAAAEIDAALGAAILGELRTQDWLPTVDDRTVSAPRAAALDEPSEDLVRALHEVVPGLLPASWSTTTLRRALDAVGVVRWGVGDVVDLLSTVQRPGVWWRAVYAALGDWGLRADPDALASLPVPLADGRTAFGARGLLLAEEGLPLAELAGLRLRIVAADAVHPLLERLGARPATAAALLADPEVRAAAEASLDDEDPEPVTAAVLTLVGAAGTTLAEHPWLADLAVPDAEGGWAAAGELVLPGSALAEVLEAEALGLVAAPAVQRWGADRLLAVGVLGNFAVLPSADVEIGDELDLDGVEQWYDAVLDRLPGGSVPPRLHAVTAVRDLELVREEGWPTALRMLSELPSAVFEPVLAELPDGSTQPVPAYTSWWLATHPVLDGERPDRLRRNGSVELTGLYDEAPADTPAFLTCPSTVDDVLAAADGGAELVLRLGDSTRCAPPGLLPDIYGRIAASPAELVPPPRVRALAGGVVEAEDAAVLDVPHVLPLVDRALVGAGGRPTEVAELLDLPLASELVTGRVDSAAGAAEKWADVPGAGLAGARLGGVELTGTVCRHDGLTLDGRPVPWWPLGSVDHVDRAAGAAALGRALAWRHDAWELRAALAEALAAPDAMEALAAEDAVRRPHADDGP